MGEKVTKSTKLRDLMVGSSWGVAQSMRAVETNRDVWSLFDSDSNAARSGRKTEKHGFLVKNLQQIPCNSRTVSRIDLGNGALDARARVGWDAERIGLESQTDDALRVEKCFFYEKPLKRPIFSNKSCTTPEPIVRLTRGMDRWVRASELVRMPRCVSAQE